ncbi:hypothetical protein M438DRAFT_339608 [Aureobasidium pullulans EXF-150]|uniref:DUF6314 domain-containing protein n=1 Tax=Aureobasidium pullulans EXF-150 TaxID=1043002 RepID=A0A074X2H8_AURPU|nr:uncharacterized protein M438DRAFT_339608 [Aureobasidium pullulans EXF-150]KEQ79598.1 hypothetical protein M438DRAFT_339608 [Aureobasidium pullulans EXF-150]
MSSALRIARVARPAVANVQVARFSIASRMMAAGDTGATRSGGAASGDAFSKREEASENLYVKRHEQEKLEQLRQKVKAGEAQLAKDKADLDKAQNIPVHGPDGCLNAGSSKNERTNRQPDRPHIESPMPPLESIFKSFSGTWKLHRSLTSALPGFPSGTFTGTATFKPHSAFDSLSLLYHETGELVTEQGYKLLANRKYIYRFSPDDEKISIWFVKEPAPDENEEVDYLFHELEFSLLDQRWIAKGDHLCEKDMYWAFYDFRLDNNMEKWGLRYKVKGPQKDYLSDSAYERVA